MKKKIIFIEGAKGVGKTYLISNRDYNIDMYKFPFPDYLNMRVETEGTKFDRLNRSAEAFQATIGYEMAVMTMFQQGVIKNSLLMDRGPISNAVFGVMNGRVDETEARMHVERLCDLEIGGSKLIDSSYHFITVSSEHSHSRIDDWQFMIGEEGHVMQQDLYLEYSKIVKQRSSANVIVFNNKKDNDSVLRFNNMMRDIINS